MPTQSHGVRVFLWAVALCIQSMGSLSKLCMWQLVTGYNLREIEVKEAMRKQLESDDADADAPEEEAI